MRKLRQTKNLFYLFLLTSYLFSCSLDNEIGITNNSTQKYFVELSQVKEMIENLSFPSNNKNLNSKVIISSKRTTKSIEEIKNVNGKTAFYVINYNEGGFILLSSDYRTPPILGFSFDNNFNVDENLFPEGLKYWVNDTKKQLLDIQNSNIVQSEAEKIAWREIQNSLVNKISGSSNSREPIEQCYEHSDIYTKGPLLSSIWEQTGGFNDALSYINCSGYPFQVYAGCVPIAMAQVMKYYQYPSNYNWSSMPIDYGTTTTANFIKDIHNAITTAYGSGQPIYNCDGTGVGSSLNMGNVLKTQFNYTSADWTNFDSNVVKNNIELNRPVILSGDDGQYGHMWVCDGYRITTYYFADCTGVGYFHFYMNWGWGPGYNGWYSNTLNSLNIQYNNNKKMIHNIIP